MEILNECSDVDEIKFQEDGSWCPMRPKKEAVKVSSPQCTKIESMYMWVLVADQHKSWRLSCSLDNSRGCWCLFCGGLTTSKLLVI